MPSTVPIGVGTAIYLEEYADRDRWYNRLLELNIQNLAAVPRSVYGILGLAFIVRGSAWAASCCGCAHPQCPCCWMVIIAAREAIPRCWIRFRQRSRPRCDAVAVQTPAVPAALPGIATGSTLASRTGESSAADHGSMCGHPHVFDLTILGEFTALLIQIYQVVRFLQEEFRLPAGCWTIKVSLGSCSA